MKSDRIFAGIWLVVAILAGVTAYSFQAPFSYEPVGPRVYPLLLAVLMVLCYLRLLQKPSEKTADTPSWPRGATLVRLLLMTTYLFAYALLFQWLGFTISTALLGIGLGRLFGGRWLYCIVGSVLMGIGLFYLFDRVLDVTLPLGDVVEPVLTVLGMN